MLGHHLDSEHEQESLQRLSHGLARHILEHGPQIAVVTQGATDHDQADRAAGPPAVEADGGHTRRAAVRRPPGCLYVVLDGQARDQVAGQLGLRRVWQGAGWVALVGLLATPAVGAFAF